jgi:hypothetical protein
MFVVNSFLGSFRMFRGVVAMVATHFFIYHMAVVWNVRCFRWTGWWRYDWDRIRRRRRRCCTGNGPLGIVSGTI